MFDRNFVESFLRLNNGDQKMSDSEVRQVLARAGWAESEISAALALLRGGSAGGGVPQAGSMASVSPNMEYSSQQLSSLLGVDINIDPSRMHYPAGVVSQTHRTFMQLFEIVAVILLALGLAAALGVSALYYLEIGPFDPTAL